MPRAPIRVILIGASTGGPAALAGLLAALPGDLAAPILVVQHIAEGFLEGLAGWLDGAGPLPVGIGGDGDVLRPASVTLAAEGANFVVDAHLRLRARPALPRQLHVPGIDPAFLAAADQLGPAALGVLLTGMGRDGACGLARLRQKGAVTISQDEASCAVYGMPAAAVSLGASELVLPLGDIAAALVALAGRR